MDQNGRDVLAVLLAAGAGTRFTGPVHKLRHTFHGQPLVRHGIDAMISAEIGPCVVITGAVDISDLLGDVTEVHNPLWGTGQRSSVQVAIDYGRTHNMDAIVFALGDQPFLTAEAWRAVAQSPSPLAVATYEGHRGHPVRIHHSLWDMFSALDEAPDAGVRTLMRLHPELVDEVACKGTSADIDTPEDLSQWT
jgi:CTP:molybdopterin cytidylyltransferase MocA